MKSWIRKLLGKKPKAIQSESFRTEIHEGDGPGVLYQTWGLSGSALWYIDEGYRNALRAGGYRWATWDPNTDPQHLLDTIRTLKPAVVLLNLQTIQRRVSGWASPEFLPKLLELKSKLGFKVACRSNPSNLGELFAQYPIDFSEFNENVRSFYQQPAHPDETEKPVFESGLIDLVRTAFYHETFDVGFRNYLELGCRILEEPHAADLVTYRPPELEQATGQDGPDVLFVGGCWPFKWRNIEPYILAMKKKFGERFHIYGQNWPNNLSSGHLPEPVFNSTIASAKINLTLHELSQTLPQPISGNERVFKLGAMNGVSLTDANPLIQYHFDVDREVAYSRNADEMVERAEFLLANPGICRQRARATHARVLNEHSYEVRLGRLIEAFNIQDQVVPYRQLSHIQSQSRKSAA